MCCSPQWSCSRRGNWVQYYSGVDLEPAQTQQRTQAKKCPDSSAGKQSTDTFKCLWLEQKQVLLPKSKWAGPRKSNALCPQYCSQPKNSCQTEDGSALRCLSICSTVYLQATGQYLGNTWLHLHVRHLSHAYSSLTHPILLLHPTVYPNCLDSASWHLAC